MDNSNCVHFDMKGCRKWEKTDDARCRTHCYGTQNSVCACV